MGEEMKEFVMEEGVLRIPISWWDRFCHAKPWGKYNFFAAMEAKSVGFDIFMDKHKLASSLPRKYKIVIQVE